MTIIALDPGVTTGVAINTELGDFLTTQWRFEVEPHLDIYEVLEILKPDLVLSEAFHFRQDKTGAVFTGVEYIGVIKYFCQRHNVQHIEITPGQGKGFWDNHKIKALGLWRPSAPHAMDAMRILLTHLMKTDSDWKEQTLAKLKETL